MALVQVRTAQFVVGASSAKAFPDWDLPEVAFAGRSNVGKSSALKALTGGKCAVRVSKTPGRTREINVFELDLVGRLPIAFIDLPGYGYASVPLRMRAQWGPLVRSYMEGRDNLKAVVLLCDARRGPEDEELGLVEWLEERSIDWICVCTKSDKLAKSKVKPAVWQAARTLGIAGSRAVAFSAKSGVGVDDLWRRILRSCRPK